MQKKLLSLIVLLLALILGLNAQTHFGTGIDSSLTVASGDVFMTDLAKSPLTGDYTAGSGSIIVSDGSIFRRGDEIIIITMIDPETDMNLNTVGRFEIHYISSVFQNQLFLDDYLEYNYTSSGGAKHQVLRIHNFTDVMVNGTMTCSNWDGTTGGVLIFRASGTLTISSTGLIHVDGKGYRGHNRQGDNQHGYQGEGIFGTGVQSTAPIGNGAGGGLHAYGGGGGGGHAYVGGVGTGADPGQGGLTVGDSSLTRVFMGGAGGTGGDNDGGNAANPNGGFGGGIIMIAANQLNNFGIISSDGSAGQHGGGGNDGGAGGGAGGSILVQTVTLQNDSSITAYGGSGYAGGSTGGTGSVGRIHLVAKTLVNTGTFAPAALESPLAGIIHLPLGDFASTSGPYSLDAMIIDEQGNTITSASVYYRVNNGGWNTVAMTGGFGDIYFGSIPGQPLASVIDYYLTATDGTDIYNSPSNPPAEFYTFEINGYPPSSFTVTDLNDGSVELNWDSPLNAGGLTGYNIYRSDVSGFTPGPSYLIGTSTDTFFIDNTVNDFYTYYYIVGANYGGSVSASQEENILVNNLSVTTILGNVYLEGQSNHANIKVLFIPNSPSAVLDSTYTNALGYYETTINPGIYTVTYDKATFQLYTRTSNLSIVDDVNFGESTLMQLGTTISGNQTGVMSGLYTVNGNITVPNGDTLIIEAGSEIRFLGNYHILVYGFLLVDGEEGDSVLFTSAPANQIQAPGQWQGFDFYNDCDDNCKVSYANIEYAIDGIYIDEASITINHCTIYSCSDRGIQLNGSTSYPEIWYAEIFSCYDGIYSYYARPEIFNMNSHNNSRYGLFFEYYSYGHIYNSSFNNNSSYGIYLYNRASPGIYDSEIKYNSSYGLQTGNYCSPAIYRCDISYNSGYGLMIGYNGNGWQSTDIVDCLIEGNSSWAMLLRHYLNSSSEIRGNTIQNNGGGVYLYYQIDSRIYNNKIIGNNSHGMYFDNNHYCDPYIHHNVIAYNNGDGIHRDEHYGSPTISYNTIYGNYGDGIEVNQNSGAFHINNNIIVNNNGYGLRSNKVVGSFEYNNVYSNGIGEISNLSNLPIDTWNYVSFNAQNDSADIYLNISEDPLLLFALDSSDLQLSAFSPCINTGDPAVYDPDQTVSDIGAYYFDMGYPHQIYVDGYDNATISLSWDSIEIDSLLSYNIYYKLNSASSYTFFGNTTILSIDVTGLINDSLYDFTATGVYPTYESDYAQKVSATPGMPGVDFNPESFNLTITTDTLNENLLVTNSGSKELHIEIPQGMTKGSVHFDGNNDYLYYNDPSALEGMTAMTMEIWVYRQSDGHIEFFGKHYRQYSMYISSNNHFGMYKGFSNDFYESYGSGWTVPINEWHHLAITWEGTDMCFYADGELVNQNGNVMANAIPNLTYYFGLGTRAHDWNYDFNGYLSEARIWNYARSHEEIQRYMYSSLDAPQTGLIGYWPLKSNYNDYSGNGINLTPAGNVYVSSSQIGFDVIPYILPNGESYDIPASSSLLIPFDFLNTGQNGTHL